MIAPCTAECSMGHPRQLAQPPQDVPLRQSMLQPPTQNRPGVPYFCRLWRVLRPNPGQAAVLSFACWGSSSPSTAAPPARAAATIRMLLSSYCRQQGPSQDGAVGWLESPACACRLAVLLIRLREVAGCRLHMQISPRHGCAHASFFLGRQ